MPVYGVCLDIDTSITTRTARFNIEAANLEAAQAIARRLAAAGNEDHEAMAYPPETVSDGQLGSVIKFTEDSYDPCRPMDIEVVENPPTLLK